MQCAEKVEHECGVWIDKFYRTTPGEGIISVLTHFHSDHIVGLNDSWDGQLYCSPITAKQVLKRYPTMDVLQLQPDTGRWTSVSDTVDIALVSCDHYIGAVMVCLRRKVGKSYRMYVHTGDFVANAEWLRKIKPIFLKLKVRKAHTLFVDNTYDTPDIGRMPHWAETLRTFQVFLNSQGIDGQKIAIVDHSGSASSFLHEYGIKMHLSPRCRESPLGRVLKHTPKAQVYIFCRGERINTARYPVRLVMSSLWHSCKVNKSRTLAVFDAKKNLYRICLATHSDQEKLAQFIKWMNPQRTVRCCKLRTTSMCGQLN